MQIVGSTRSMQPAAPSPAWLILVIRRNVAQSMMTPQSSRVRIIFRVLAALLALVALPLFIMGVQELHSNWHFTAALFGFILIFGYVAITGKAPFPFR
jgi:hypothetical protein